MLRELEKTAASLADARAAWITRRDAADSLGAAAEGAIRALRQHSRDKDPDVRSAAERALGRVGGAMANVPPQRGYSLDELARACDKPGQRAVEPQGDGYLVTVETGDGRRQRVSIEIREGRRGPLLVLTTCCGKPTPDVVSWALAANMDLSLGALALDKSGAEDMLVIRGCFLPGEATPQEVKAAVKELAFYGDWIERKLAGTEDAQ